MKRHDLHSSGPYFQAGIDILKQISLGLDGGKSAVSAYVAGGQAVAYWTCGKRMSLDLDVLFSHRMIIEQGLHAFIKTDNPLNAKKVCFDYNFNDTFSLIHHEYPERAAYLLSCGNLRIFILSPVDLALMKASRFSERDRSDIRELINNDLVSLEDFRNLAFDALNDYVGNLTVIENTIDIISEWFPSEEEKPCISLRP